MGSEDESVEKNRVPIEVPTGAWTVDQTVLVIASADVPLGVVAGFDGPHEIHVCKVAALPMRCPCDRIHDARERALLRIFVGDEAADQVGNALVDTDLDTADAASGCCGPTELPARPIDVLVLAHDAPDHLGARQIRALPDQAFVPWAAEVCRHLAGALPVYGDDLLQRFSDSLPSGRTIHLRYASAPRSLPQTALKLAQKLPDRRTVHQIGMFVDDFPTADAVALTESVLAGPAADRAGDPLVFSVETESPPPDSHNKAKAGKPSGANAPAVSTCVSVVFEPTARRSETR